MSDKLMIEQLTEGLEMEKMAEEAEMEKMAQVCNVVDQAQTLTLIGEDMYKIASELGDESLAALAVDTYGLGDRMGSCLVKTASEDSESMADSLEIAEDMHKLASVYADLADETGDETLVKMAEAMIPIANEMVEEANGFYEEMNKEAGVRDMAQSVKGAFAGKEMGKYLKKTTKNAIGQSGHEEGLISELKYLLSHKKGLKSALPAVAAYGGSAAALAGAGYGAKKAFGKKD